MIRHGKYTAFMTAIVYIVAYEASIVEIALPPISGLSHSQGNGHIGKKLNEGLNVAS